MTAGRGPRFRVVDLPRVRAALARLDVLAAAASPEVRQRTADLFATDPDLDTLEALLMTPENEAEPLTGSQPVKLPPDLLARADDLVPLLAARPELAGYGRVTRAAVVRLALARGLDTLAAELAAPPKAGKARTRG